VSDFLLVALVAAVAVVFVMAATTLAADLTNRVLVVDVAWGLGYVVIALVSAWYGGTRADTDDRRWLVLVMVALWGFRLAWHIRTRVFGTKEDPRYVKLLGGTLDQVGIGIAIRKVFGLQGVVMWFIALPVVMASATSTRWWPVVWVGVALWALGLVFETVGDAQLKRYRALPKGQKPQVLDTGLWRYTRHPNYFGDACVWWGIWTAGALASGPIPALVTVLCPVAMSYFLVHASGARLLEQTMMKRPGYPEYAKRTSMFIPLPPRKA
jgi:steroid 5-alpha reductase family enzyme